jgi:pleckstrin homology domain-containing family M member 1
MIFQKENILLRLSEAVKEVQLQASQEGQQISLCDSAQSLCSALESVLLHGLKDTLSSRFFSAPSSFWPVVLLISHRNSVAAVERLNQIKTDVGRCRAWLRLCLSDSSLTSYLSLTNAARSLYHSHALLRDPDASDVAYRLVLGLQHVNFDLPANSSLLNVWTTASNNVIAAAQDVALGIEYESKPEPQKVWI